MKGKRVLVTGASGFLGVHLVERLVGLGADVVAATGPTSPTASIAGATVIRLDLRDPRSVEACGAHRPQIVFHLGGLSRVGDRGMTELLDQNTKGTALLLDATRGSEAFVFASSAEVYGRQERMPLDESMQPAPLSPYGVSKLSAELACFARARADRRRVTVLRLFSVFGPGQRPPSLVPAVLSSLEAGEPVRATKGAQTRDLLYIDDALDALLAAARCDPLDGPVNVCSGRETSVAEVIHSLARLWGGDPRIELGALPYRESETWRIFGDGARAARLLGFRARVPLEEGLRRTVAWAKGSGSTTGAR